MTRKKNTATSPVGDGSAVVSDAVKEILDENTRRVAEINAKFNPVTGEGSIGKRVLVEISDFPFRRQWLPEQMMNIPLVKQLAEHGWKRTYMGNYGIEHNDFKIWKVERQ